jgi:hypothetical protein
MKRLAVLFVLVAAVGCKKTEEQALQQPMPQEPAGTYTSTTTTTPVPPAMPPAPKEQGFSIVLGGTAPAQIEILDQESGAKFALNLTKPVEGGALVKLVASCDAGALVLADIGAVEQTELRTTLPTGQALEGKAVAILDRDDKQLSCGVIAAPTKTPTVPGPIPPQPAY